MDKDPKPISGLLLMTINIWGPTEYIVEAAFVQISVTLNRSHLHVYILTTAYALLPIIKI